MTIYTKFFFSTMNLMEGQIQLKVAKNLQYLFPTNTVLKITFFNYFSDLRRSNTEIAEEYFF